jgi:hypothetical protein
MESIYLAVNNVIREKEIVLIKKFKDFLVEKLDMPEDDLEQFLELFDEEFVVVEEEGTIATSATKDKKCDDVPTLKIEKASIVVEEKVTGGSKPTIYSIFRDEYVKKMPKSCTIKPKEAWKSLKEKYPKMKDEPLLEKWRSE